MSPSLSQDQLRADYAPACEHHDVANLTEAWLVVAGAGGIMHAFGYAPREGETFAANCRPVTGGQKVSMHALFGKGSWLTWTNVKVNTANATDFNSRSNPYGKTLKTDMPRPMVDAILALRTMNGVPVFGWGGYFSTNKDAMHFEIRCSRADLATGIDPSTIYGGTVAFNPDQEKFILDALTRVDNRTSNLEKVSGQFVQVILQQIKDAVDAPHVAGGAGQITAADIDAIADEIFAREAKASAAAVTK